MEGGLALKIKTMVQVKIEIVNTKLEEMDIEQPVRYATLRFNESHFIGYWVSNEGANLTFYLGCQSFLCKNCELNIALFESILKKDGQN
jgi:hypothetical protein